MTQPRTLSGSANPRRKFPAFAKRLIKGLAALAIFAVVGLTMLLTLLWWEHKTEVTLPAPAGHFAVGRTTYAWVNNTRTDELAPSSGAKREVVVWIWYPSAAVTSAVPVEYLPAPWRSALAQHSGALMSQFFTRDLSLVRAHSTSDPEVSPERPSYPVVIMRAGGGALTTDYTTLTEDLASHGYIVVGFDAPYRTFVVVLPDNRVVIRPPTNDPENLQADQANGLINRLLPMWSSDTAFVVTQLGHLNAADPSGKFTGRLDMQRLGMFGHSFGGATALQFCHDDSRCKAGIDMDGAPFGSVVQEGLKQPFMFIFSDHSRELSDPASRQILADIQSIYGRLPSGRLLITIRRANHFSFSDQMLLKSHYVIGLLRLFGFSGLDGRRGLAITAEYVRTFFDVYLKDAPIALLNKPSQLYPEVQFVLQ
ncbi:MAG TPA: family membership [Candidatus Limnocylindria bacterium]|nr:family membership [Candidatus Limnocylindria bacterium]